MKFKEILRLCIATLLLIAMTSNALAQEIHTSICDLVNNGSIPSNKEVRIKAIFMSDLLERSVLIDNRCPKIHIQPDYEITSSNKSIKTFDAALRGKIDDHELRLFIVDVTGRFMWSSGEERYGYLKISKFWAYKRVHGNWKKQRM